MTNEEKLKWMELRLAPIVLQLRAVDKEYAALGIDGYLFDDEIESIERYYLR